MSSQTFSNESLLAVPIKDDEIFELLERLAATEEMFIAPVSTIRDVAELTDASPKLIARLLAEMRGPDAFENLEQGYKDHEGRLSTVEQKLLDISLGKAPLPKFDKPPLREFKPKHVSEGPKLSAWEESEDYYLGKGIYARKKAGVKAMDVIAVIVVLIIICVVFATRIMSGKVRIDQPSLPPPYEQRS